MTVYNELNKIAYIGSSEQTLYPIPFEYINTDDIKVSVYTSNNEFVEDWTYSTQYVIEGGNVKVLSGYNIDNTKKLLVLRRVDLIQENKYREGGDFPAKSTETSFDKLTMITQQLQETLDRCIKVEVLDIQTPEELLQSVYDKLDSATEIAGDAINAANQAQTAADNATVAVNRAEQTLVQTQAYVDAAKVEINNTMSTAIETIDSTVSTAKGNIANTVVSAKSDINNVADNAINEITTTANQAKSDINTAIDEATMNVSDIISNAEDSITNIAVTEANKAIANAAQEATDKATANVNSYVDGTVKPSLQTYVNQAQEYANNAATSMEQAALSATAASNDASLSRTWATGTDDEVQGIEKDEHSSRTYANFSMALANTPEDVPVLESVLLATDVVKGPKGDPGETVFSGDISFTGTFDVHSDNNHPIKVTGLAGTSASGYQITDSGGLGDSDFEHYASGDRYGTKITNHNNTSNTSVSIDMYQSNAGKSVIDFSGFDTMFAPALLATLYPVGSIYITTNATCPLETLGVGTWELVAADRVLQGAGSRGAVGSTLEESLPNIIGHVKSITISTSQSTKVDDINKSGVFEKSKGIILKISPQNTTNATWTRESDIQFNASRSSSIYKDNAHVQPSAYLVNVFRRIS